ncbi:MAG TPA: serine O-acetyltransferase EpsC [Dongiaceae bacterium]|nr:serine O-acetyltransferase EpsC [Dongiaceae bacterium]
MSNIHWELDSLVGELRQTRERWRKARQRDPEAHGREFPSQSTLGDIARYLSAVLFPMRLGPSDLRPETEDFFIGHTLDKALTLLLDQARLELRFATNGSEAGLDIEQKAMDIVKRFAAGLPGIRSVLDSDVEAAYRGDPAARSMDEVLLCYPGIRAMIHHRLAHSLFQLGLPLLARIIAEIAHSDTGIDIHPGAQIGGSFFIDHGTGVVIGETSVIGERVRIYQAVTLGAKRFELDDQGDLKKGGARHPIVEDDVVIYAGATILGRITIGRGSSIGGNVWLTYSVPPGSQITQATSENRAQPR